MGRMFGRSSRALSLDQWGGFQPRASRGPTPATGRQSLQASVKWACLRLRADLVSTTPLDVFRRVGGVQVEMPKPPSLRAPGGTEIAAEEWLYSTQFDLDNVGNAFGEIVARDGQGLPAVIELYPPESVVVRVHKGVKEYRFDGRKVDPTNVWHEKQFTTSGSPVGLSPTAFSAMSIGGYLSAQQFASEWFSGGGIAATHFKNTAKTVTSEESQVIKARFDAQVANGGMLVTGNDWEYNILGAKASEAAFVDAIKVSAPDQCRFYGVPGDMVDVESSTGSVTYANVTQRNLQLLIINLGPTYIRRERWFSAKLLPASRYAKFTTDALMRMDPASRSEKLVSEVRGRTLAPSEARELDNRPPFTDAQLAEFDRLFPTRTTAPAKEPTQ